MVTYDGIDTRADGWEWLLLIKAGVDSQERRKIGFRTYGTLRQRHRNGTSAGGKARGYTHAQDGDYRVKVVVPEEAKIVKRIFKMYADGMSHRQIAHTLNDEGIPSPGAKRNRRGRLGQRRGAGEAGASGAVRRPAADRDRAARVDRRRQHPLCLEDTLSDGTSHVIFEPLDFIARLAALVPKPRAHLTRYHGIFAPNSAVRALLVAGRKAGRGSGQEQAEQTDAKRHRAMSLKCSDSSGSFTSRSRSARAAAGSFR